MSTSATSALLMFLSDALRVSGPCGEPQGLPGGIGEAMKGLPRLDARDLSPSAGPRRDGEARPTSSGKF